MSLLDRLTPTKIIGALAALIILSTGLGSFYTVSSKEVGVLTRNGKVVGLAQPGLGWKVPFIDDVTEISTLTETVVFDKMNAYSFDQQPADLKLSITAHVNPAKADQLFMRFGTIANYMKQRVGPISHQQAKIVFGGYTAVRAIQERGPLNSAIATAIEKSADDELVIIDAIQVENIDFSDIYIKSIEQRMLAEVGVQKVVQDAAREIQTAKITVTKAQAAADGVLAQAKAEAASTKLKGEAEAYAITARAAALGQNPLLIELTKAEKWNGILPTTMVPGSTVPFINVK